MTGAWNISYLRNATIGVCEAILSEPGAAELAVGFYHAAVHGGEYALNPGGPGSVAYRDLFCQTYGGPCDVLCGGYVMMVPAAIDCLVDPPLELFERCVVSQRLADGSADGLWRRIALTRPTTSSGPEQSQEREEPCRPLQP